MDFECPVCFLAIMGNTCQCVPKQLLHEEGKFQLLLRHMCQVTLWGAAASVALVTGVALVANMFLIQHDTIFECTSIPQRSWALVSR